ncbi:Alpha/beta hydrolase fold-1 [Annulohypoxylon truncatum]|uniref:Alpha/beta hydrolase fold-1 n=1 Tax=Annulohypoxylon truncatum TaxID=327061 RepID=UPI002008D7A4|nr:Alpha/beta hydrolase fold-1 [Annulohypoxylon truncatum]KAI1208931.1 Alpha/beta hydrolase fold-1 [Annulohypoxylon truncatum]
MASQEKPTILLIHGAWHIPLHYRSLIDPLRSSGYTVLAPYLVTTGYDDSIDGKTHADSTNQIREYLRPLLDQGRKILVVAHSAGGVVATGAAAGLTLEDRAAQGLPGGIIGIVYIAALVEPKHGRPDEPIPFPPGWTDFKKRPVPEDLARMLFYDDVEESRQNKALQMLHWQSEMTYDPEESETVVEVRTPKTFVVCKKDKIVPPDKQYQRAAEIGATLVELDCAHSPFLLDKETEVLLDVITKAAKV